ncbi:MAG: hypothetical protein OEY34_08535 [Cyclobacteriaceae bacterium]|nr:hypothetical protein [Cyclobacteriaceae bacterium]
MIKFFRSIRRNLLSKKETLNYIRYAFGEIVDEIIPHGCIMAGDWKKDAPWKK